MERFNRRSGRKVSGFTQAAVDALLLYAFPGNVRELENMIERAAILTLNDEPIDTLHLFHGRHRLQNAYWSPTRSGNLAEQTLVQGDAEATPNVMAGLQLAEIESIVIREAMTAARGNVSAAAR